MFICVKYNISNLYTIIIAKARGSLRGVFFHRFIEKMTFTPLTAARVTAHEIQSLTRTKFFNSEVGFTIEVHCTAVLIT